KVKISETNRTGKNAITSATRSKNEIDADFHNIYSNHFINYQQQSRKFVNDGFGNMLIVCHGPFMKEMNDFVNWKKIIGYNVEMVDYATIGSSKALKKYVKNYYNTNGLTYLILVGDHQQIPSIYKVYNNPMNDDGYSDNEYAYVEGDDRYPDFFVGRLSAENTDHVKTQVEKTIHYERELSPSANWFKKGIGSASTGGLYPTDEEHMNEVLEELEDFGYSVDKCYENGGTIQQFTNLVNDGAGIINYIGHGLINGWNSFHYYNEHVDNLKNTEQWPFIISVACIVGSFTENTCYAEAWLRASHNGKPTGAVVHAASTVYQYWYEPLIAQGTMINLMISKQVRTFAGMQFNGMYKMNDIYGTHAFEMTDTWTCFGDPSLQLRTPGNPEGPNTNGSQSPTVSLIQPGNGNTFPEGSDIQISATSSDEDGTIEQVEFFANGTSIGIDKTAPYTASFPNARPGKYVISACATDNDKLTTTDEVNITVGNPADAIVVDSTILRCNHKNLIDIEFYLTVKIQHDKILLNTDYVKVIPLADNRYKIIEMGYIPANKIVNTTFYVYNNYNQAASLTHSTTLTTSCTSTQKYTISASAGANGSITPSGNVNVKKDANQTFTIKANAGYKIKDVLVDGKSVGAISSYKFKKVKKNHTIKATFKATGTVNPIEITNKVSKCDNSGKAMNEIYFTVNIHYTKVKSVYGSLTDLGGNNFKISEHNVGFNSELDYIINVYNGNSEVASKTTYITSVSSCNSVQDYTITATAGANGSISPSGNVKVTEGSSQTFTITANTGYKVNDVLVDGKSKGAKTKHTFTNVKANHTIEATFEKDGSNNNAILIKDVVTDCNKKGKARNIIYLNVSVPHNNVTVNRGYVIKQGSGNYKIRDIGMAKGSTYTYKFTAKNGGKVVGMASKAVTAVHGCRKSAESFETRESTFTMSPNPACEFVNIALAGYSNATVLIFDVHGKVVLERDHVENETTLDTSELPAGLYFVRIYDNQQTGIQRLIIE
ncbi:MAG: C25 family cysteine peptidase, partial [Bacteroidales bacterium]|nr:C25 family cysteine peptidase [Bacteroidales bacterium]